MTDSEFIYELLDGVEQVYHCAAVVSFSQKIENMNHNNVQRHRSHGQYEPFKKCEEVLSCEFSVALGKNTDGSKVTEETYFVNSPQNSNYGISKYNAEHPSLADLRREGFKL